MHAVDAGPVTPRAAQTGRADDMPAPEGGCLVSRYHCGFEIPVAGNPIPFRGVPAAAEVGLKQRVDAVGWIPPLTVNEEGTVVADPDEKLFSRSKGGGTESRGQRGGGVADADDRGVTLRSLRHHLERRPRYLVQDGLEHIGGGSLRRSSLGRDDYSHGCPRVPREAQPHAAALRLQRVDCTGRRLSLQRNRGGERHRSQDHPHGEPLCVWSFPPIPAFRTQLHGAFPTGGIPMPTCPSPKRLHRSLELGPSQLRRSTAGPSGSTCRRSAFPRPPGAKGDTNGSAHVPGASNAPEAIHPTNT